MVYRDYNKSGNSSPSTRSHSPWRDYREHYREVQHRLYAKHLQEGKLRFGTSNLHFCLKIIYYYLYVSCVTEWKKVEQDLVKGSQNFCYLPTIMFIL